MPEVIENIEIKGDPKKIFEIIMDLEAYPQYMNAVKKIEIVERGEGYVMSKWTTSASGITLRWTEKDTYDLENLTVHYKLTEGDISKFEGHWKVIPVAENLNLVELKIDFDIGVPMLEAFVGPMAKAVVTQNAKGMLSGLKEKIEGGL
ncbi:MAG: Persistence and stress-resistance toxin PasT [candidate division WS2 bacterium]|nr:Persistence and stress-resistance toxin PasT [Candidatus Lithacetigena glycinireducens]